MKNHKTETTRKSRKTKKVISPISKRKSVKQNNVLKDSVVAEPKSFITFIKTIISSLIVKVKGLL